MGSSWASDTLATYKVISKVLTYFGLLTAQCEFLVTTNYFILYSIAHMASNIKYINIIYKSVLSLLHWLST